MSDEPKYHCHLFTFLELNEFGNYSYKTIINGHEDKNITAKRAKDAKEGAGVSDSGILLHVSYLGYMTQSEAVGEDYGIHKSN